MKNVFAAIVCYNPDIIKLERNVRSIIRQVDQVVIIDNGSNNYNEYKTKLQDIGNIDFCRLTENFGIAFALNKALEYCVGKCEWLVTLDQDSCAADDMVESLYAYKHLPKVAIISPRIVDVNYPAKEDYGNNNFLELTSAITSGCLNNVNILYNSSGFDSRMFIDYVDHEICLRLKTKGYKILLIPSAILYQEVGQISSHKFCGLKIPTTNHSPFRRYFLFRNKIYVFKKYCLKFPGWCLRDFGGLFKAMMKILLLENNKKENFKYIKRGIYDGVRGHFDNKWPFSQQ